MIYRPNVDQTARDALEDLGLLDNDRTEDLRSSTNHDGGRVAAGLVYGRVAQSFSESQRPESDFHVHRYPLHLPPCECECVEPIKGDTDRTWLCGTPSLSEDFIMDPDVAHHRAKVVGIKYAIIAGRRPPDDPELMAELGHLRAAGVRDRARKLLAELPGLTPEHLQRIAQLLRAGIEDAIKEVTSNGKG